MTEKRFTIDVLDENNWLIQDTKTGEDANPIDGTTNVLKGLISTLNKFNDENEQLKQSVSNLKDTIIKITIAYQRKYDRNIVDLVDELHDEDITDLIKELQE